MKKLKVFVICLLLACSTLIFASCQKVSSISFEQNEIVLEVGETFNPEPIITPKKAKDADVKYTSQNRSVAIVTPDNKIQAVGEGTTQIEAKTDNEKTAYIVVEVVSQKEKLNTPVGLTYNSITDSIIWSAVENANSYDVEINGEIAKEKSTVASYQLTSSGDVKTVRVKANGIDRFKDSDWTQEFKFTNLVSPTNVKFDKSTMKLTWDYATNASFRVSVNGQLTEITTNKYHTLSLNEANLYNISVIAVNVGEAVQNGVVVFNSLNSNSVSVTRLANIKQDSIVWNPTISSLTWDKIEGAEYEVSIDGGKAQRVTTNAIEVLGLTRGAHNVQIKAVSDDSHTLSSSTATLTSVAITEQLPTPVIESYTNSTRKLILTNVGPAKAFKVLVNGQVAFDENVNVVSGKAEITLPANLFNVVGEHEIVAISKEDSARFYAQSNQSEKYTLKRLSAPTNLRIDNGTDLKFAINPDAEFGYKVAIGNSEHEIDEAEYNIFNLTAGAHEIRVKYLGNDTTILESEYSSITATKLQTPVLEFNKLTSELFITAESNHKFDITNGDFVLKSVVVNPYNLSGQLEVGNNQISVQTKAEQNEINSDVATIIIKRVAQIQLLEHESINNVSYLTFNANSDHDEFIIKSSTLSDPISYTQQAEAGKTKLKLTTPSSEIFNKVGEISITIQAISTNLNHVNPDETSLHIYKLETPTNLEYIAPKTFAWTGASSVSSDYQLIVYDEQNRVAHNKTISETSVEISDLELGNFSAVIVCAGDNKTTMSSEPTSILNFTHTRELEIPTLSFDKEKCEISINLQDQDASEVEVYLDGSKVSTYNYAASLVYSFGNSLDQAKSYEVFVKAKNLTNQFILDSVSETLTISRLQTPTNLAYSNEQLSWNIVDGAEGYELTIVGTSQTITTTTDTPRFSTIDLVPGQYSLSIRAYNQDQLIISSHTASQDFEIRRTLTTPTNLQYSKSQNTITFDEVKGADKYEIYVNGIKEVEVTTNSYTFNSTRFNDAGEYDIVVMATSNNAYINQSLTSTIVKITRLAAPTAFTLSENIITIPTTSNLVESVEILIKDDNENQTEIATDSVENFAGKITVRAKYVGSGENNLDSAYATFQLERLLAVNNFKLKNDKLVWSSVANATLYEIVIQPENEANPYIYQVPHQSGELTFEYDFELVCGYDISITAIGDTTKYLNSQTSKITATKAVAPTNVSLFENLENSTITVSFESEQTGVAYYELIINGIAVTTVEATKREFIVSSSLLEAGGYYMIQVRAVGDNTSGVISSSPSDAFLAERLFTPMFNQTGVVYYANWITVHSQTEYIVTVSHPDSSTIIYTETTQANFVSFYEQATSDEFKDLEGTIHVTITAKGNNTTLLRSGSQTIAIQKTPKTVITSDADKIYFTKSNPETAFEMIVYYDDPETPIDQRVIYGSEFVIPDYYTPGEYTFVVRQFVPGEYISGETKFVKSRLNRVNVDNAQITRDSTNEDILWLSWDAVQNASGYVVSYSSGQDLNFYPTQEIYRGTATKFALPDDITSGQVFFWFTTLGSAEHGFSSDMIWLNRTKIPYEVINVRNEGGQLAWTQTATPICEKYKIVINGEDVIYVDSATTTHALTGFSGQLNIKIKAVGKDFGIDSQYAELNIVKLPKPTNIRVVEGEIKADIDFADQSVGYVVNVDGKHFALTTEGVQEMTRTLLSENNYSFKLVAKNTDQYLTSDESDAITAQILPSANTNDGTTYISTNQEKTISTFNWTSAVGAGKYEVMIKGEDLGGPIKNIVLDTNWAISGLNAGKYSISVRRVGQTGATDGVNYLSSSFSSGIGFTVLVAPKFSVSDGELVWESQEGASDYYLYNGDAYKATGNVDVYTFLSEYVDDVNATNLTLHLQAIGDGIKYLASDKSETIKIVKPRPPQMVEVKDGGLKWVDLEGYTYFSDTENKNILLEFIQNGEVVESFEIDVETVSAGWPKGDNYLQKLTSNLPTGKYTVRVKQIGDDVKVITSEYNAKTMEIVVAPNPQNVRVDQHKLMWDAVELEYYNSENLIEYVVYAFDTSVNDWVNIHETTDTFFNVENTDQMIKTTYNAFAVATKGNTTTLGYINYVTGNMSKKVDIIVLGSTSDLSTVEGYLTWGTVANALNYKIQSDENDMEVDGGVQESYLPGFVAGVHNVRVRALGNGSSLNSQCIINGIWGESLKFTKLASTLISSQTTAEDKPGWGLVRWEDVENTFGYNVFVDGELYFYLENLTYESDVNDTNEHIYNIQAKGNTAVPSAGNIAYVSSDLSNSLNLQRKQRVEGVEVVDGKLYWRKSDASTSNRYYFVEFHKNGELFEKVFVSADASKIVNINGQEKVEFDVAGYVTDGSYTVIVKEVDNSKVYIMGIGSHPIEISKLATPGNVHLDKGILTWNKVLDATGYVVKLIDISSNTVEEITEGFSEENGMFRWVSPKTSHAQFYVSVRAVSVSENYLSSSWANKFGEITSENTWLITQIPKIKLSEINYDGNNVTWTYANANGVPENAGYMIWRSENASPEDLTLFSNEYPIDFNLKGVKVRTFDLAGGDYFASVFSEEKAVVKPSAPTGLEFKETEQVFTWDKVDGDDVLYIVTYKINDGEEQILQTSENKFEPNILGSYAVCVQVQKSATVIGTSEPSEVVLGEFDLFSAGLGTKESPFEVNAENFANIMFRPNANFKLTENVTLNNITPFGLNGSAVTPFKGTLDGVNHKVNVSFREDINSMYIGLFAALGDGAEIKNLKVQVSGDIYISGFQGKSYVGVIAGQVDGVDARIDNCQVSGTITIEKSNQYYLYFGGLVGELKKGTVQNSISALNVEAYANYGTLVGGITAIVSSTGGKIDNCSNSGTIKEAHTIGGIAAYNAGTITNCSNSGSLTSETYIFGSVKENSIVGGIVGQNIGARESDTVVGGIVTGCENTGNITASNSNGETSQSCYAGGIVGLVNNGKLANNQNSGTVSLSEEAAANASNKAGDIVGYVEVDYVTA